MRIETVNGIDFEVINPNTKQAAGIVHTFNYFMNRYGSRSIMDAYKNPSSRKRSIWQEWRNWFFEYGASQMTVMGASSHTFSIGIYDRESNTLFYITAGHNRMIKEVSIC